jgi:hypothetical protein
MVGPTFFVFMSQARSCIAPQLCAPTLRFYHVPHTSRTPLKPSISELVSPFLFKLFVHSLWPSQFECLLALALHTLMIKYKSSFFHFARRFTLFQGIFGRLFPCLWSSIYLVPPYTFLIRNALGLYLSSRSTQPRCNRAAPHWPIKTLRSPVAPLPTPKPSVHHVSASLGPNRP